MSLHTPLWMQSLTGKTVLLAEDDPQVRTTVKRFLEQNGFTVMEARNARMALQMAETHQGQIDVLVADVVMPGMNGVDLARQLRLTRPEIKVIFVSGYADDPLVRRILLGYPHFVPKPLLASTLVGTIRKALQKPEELSLA